MEDRDTLTGFSQSRYNEIMNEGGADLLERDIASFTDDELEHAVDKWAQEQVTRDTEHKESIEGKKDEGGNVVEKRKKLQDTIDKYQHVLEVTTIGEQLEKRSEQGPAAIILREVEEVPELGWNKNEINKLQSFFEGKGTGATGEANDFLKLNKASSINMVENLIATGQRPENVWANLKKEELDSIQVQDSPYRPKSEEEKESEAKLLFIKNKLGIDNEKYIQRFILDKEYHESLFNEYDNSLPDNINELAWQIGFKYPDYAAQGEYPVLQMELDRDKSGNITGGSYKVNQANIIRWMRKELLYYQDKDEDEITNYLTNVKLSKPLRPVDLNEIFDNKDRYFTDEEGKSEEYDGLYAQMLSEVIGMLHLRTHDLTYQSIMGSGKDLAQKLNELYYKSKLMKKSFGTSYMNVFTTMPLDYSAEKSDDTLGSAFTTMYLAHYNLGDFEELQNTLGKDSKIFTRDGLIDAIQDVYKDQYKAIHKVPQTDAIKFLGEHAGNFEKAFDENGNITTKENKEKYIAFMNMYTGGSATSHIRLEVVKRAMKNAMKERYDFNSKEQNDKVLTPDQLEKGKIDESALEMAWLMVNSMMRFSGGAARNDTGAGGYDFQNKLLSTEIYRRKMATESRGNGAGNPFTVPQFKSVLVDMMRGIRVTEGYKEVVDQRGEKVNKINKKTGKNEGQEYRRATPLEVFQDLNKEKAEQRKLRKELEQSLEAKGVSRLEKKKARREFESRIAKRSRGISGQLVFNENAMRDYALNHFSKAQLLYDQILKADEIDFDKFVEHDRKGIRFKRKEFQDAVQQGLLHPARYLFSTYGELNFNMPVRANKFLYRDESGKDVTEFTEMPLGEAMFGYQILNIPEFRMCEKDGAGNEIAGKYVKDPHHHGRYMIDYNKVQENKAVAYKQWTLMKLGADFWSHIDKHSTDPRYGITHYQNILHAIDEIPAEIEGHDDNMRHTHVTKTYFAPEQMKWLKKMSGTTSFQLYRRAIFEDLFGTRHDKSWGFGDSFSLLLGAIFRGY